MSDTGKPEALIRLEERFRVKDENERLVWELIERHTDSLDKLEKRLDGWNGSIPHIKDSVIRIESTVGKFFEGQKHIELDLLSTKKDLSAAEQKVSNHEKYIGWLLKIVLGAVVLQLLATAFPGLKEVF